MSEDNRLCEVCVHWHRAYNPRSIFRASETFGWCDQLEDFTHESRPPQERICSFRMVSDEEFERRQALIEADMDLRAKLRGERQ